MHTYVYSFHKVFDNPLVSSKTDFLATYSGPGFTKENSYKTTNTI